EVSTFITSDEDGDDVTVTLSDTVNYAIVDGTVVLTEAGAALVNSGEALPEFTLTPNDGMVDGDTDSATPVVTTVDDASITAPDSITTNEDTAVIIDVLDNDTDEDSEVSPVASVTNGTNGTVAINDDGTVTYTPDADFNGSDTFTYTNEDGNTETVNVTVNPVDDPTEILVGTSDSDIGEVTEDEEISATQTLTDSGTLTFSDVDTEDSENFAPTVEFSPENEGDSALGEISIDADGNWTYEVDNSAVQFLGEGESLVEVFTVTLNGTSHDITVTINGSEDPTTIEPVGTRDAYARLFEDDDDITPGFLTTNDTLEFGDADDSDSASFEPEVNFTSSTSSLGQLGSVTLENDGNWSYSVDNSLVQYLDEGEKITEIYTVTLNGTEEIITIDIIGTEDATEIVVDTSAGDSAEGEVSEDSADTTTLTDSGKITFIDVDDSDRSSFAPTVVFAASTAGSSALGELTIDADGNWTYEVDNSDIAYLDTDETIVETFTVELNGETQDISVTVNGANSAPEIQITSTNELTEDTAVEGTIVSTFTTFDAEGDDVTVSISDSVNYAIVDNTIVLTEAGAELVNSGQDLPEYTLTTNDGSVDGESVSSTPLVIPVATTPAVNITIDTEYTESISLSAENYNETDSGYTVTAYTATGVQTTLSSITGTTHDGFGVSGRASGANAELGYLNNTGSESIVVDIDYEITSADVAFSWLNPNETAAYSLYSNGVLVGSGTINGGSNNVDDPITINANGEGFDQIVFTAPGSGDDYLINSISFDKVVEEEVTDEAVVVTEGGAISLNISTEDTVLDDTESLALVISDIPNGFTLSDGENTYTSSSDDGLIDVTSWDLDNLTLLSTEVDSTSYYELFVTATTTESLNGETSSTETSINLIVASDDSIFGSDEADDLNGTINDDSILGLAGDDELSGGIGNDILVGGAGDDNLIDSVGNDTMIGGIGADTFTWSEGDAAGTDIIVDFDIEEGDALDLSDLLQGETESTLSEYFEISFDGIDTTLNVSSTESGENVATIILEDIQLEGITHDGELSSSEVETVINTLYEEGALIISDNTDIDTSSSTSSLDDDLSQ
ncbi:VCBS domain-containing protein, partial [Psychromonas sp.]|uniref:VCBS domain-containing protein n=1 Tax=Psychromonas sp. TaxID=1884585 RepID=UPI003A979E58